MSTKELTTEDELMFAIDKMFRFKSRSIQIPKIKQMQYALDIVKSCFWVYEIRYDKDSAPTMQDAEYYKERKGIWYHQAGTTDYHNHVGMAWAGKMIKRGFEVILTDSPDIYAEWYDEELQHKYKLWGDVGQCSWFPAFFDTGFWSMPHDLWVSVFDWGEIVMEAKVHVNGGHPDWDGHTSDCAICNRANKEP